MRRSYEEVLRKLANFINPVMGYLDIWTFRMNYHFRETARRYEPLKTDPSTVLLSRQIISVSRTDHRILSIL